MNRIGTDCMLEIASFLQTSDALTLLQLNSTWNELANSDLFWKIIYRWTMIHRLNSSRKKNYKLKIKHLINRQIDNCKDMYNRSCVEEGELVFKKILKKEIESRRVKENTKRLNHVSQPGYYWNDQILNSYKDHWNDVKDLIAPTLASFNQLGKKYPLSTKLQETFRRNLIHDTKFVQHNCPNRNIIVKGISETVNNFGKYLLEIDDVFALSVIEIAYTLEQVDLLKKALDKLSGEKYEISPFGLGKIRVMQEKEVIFYKLLTIREYECSYCDKFLKLLLLCFDKSLVVQLLSTGLDKCDKLPLEKREFLLENGFVLP